MITIEQLVEEMKVFARQHPMKSGQIADTGCMREYAYSDEYKIVCVLTINLYEDIQGLQLSLAHEDKETEIPDEVATDFLNAFFGADLVEQEKVFELPRFPIFPVQRQFVAALEGDRDNSED